MASARGADGLGIRALIHMDTNVLIEALMPGSVADQALRR
jgi:hypothetical protein